MYKEFILIVRCTIYKAVIEGNCTMSVCDEDPREQVPDHLGNIMVCLSFQSVGIFSLPMLVLMLEHNIVGVRSCKPCLCLIQRLPSL